MGFVLYCRLDREKTGSYLTYKLPHPMTVGEADRWVEKTLPEWELIHSTRVNPDGKE